MWIFVKGLPPEHDCMRLYVDPQTGEAGSLFYSTSLDTVQRAINKSITVGDSLGHSDMYYGHVGSIAQPTVDEIDDDSVIPSIVPEFSGFLTTMMEENCEVAGGIARRAVTNLGNIIGKNVTVYCSHGQRFNPRSFNDPDRIYFIIWGAPQGYLTAKKSYKSIAGFKLKPGQADGHELFNTGYPISLGRCQCATMIDNFVYLHVDLFHCDNHLRDIMELLSLAVRDILKDPEAYNAHMELIKEERAKLIEVTYIKFCNTRTQARVNGIKNSIRDNEYHYQELMNRLPNILRSIQEYQRELKSFEEGRVEDVKVYVDEFKRLITHPDLVEIRFDSNSIIFTTTPIIIEHDEELYDLGSFDIRVGIGNSNSIIISNLTGSHNGMYHPHIRDDGRCCFGNISESITKLIASHEYSVIFNIMIQYLKSYNAKDAYGSITYFKKAKKQVVQKPKEEEKIDEAIF